MAEVAGAVGLLASITQLVDVAIKACDYVNGVKNAPEEQAIIAEEASLLVNLLLQLRRKVNTAHDSSADKVWLEASFKLTPYLNTLHHALEKVAPKVVSNQDGRLGRLSKRLVWPWNEEKCKQILLRIERLKSLIQIALQESTLTLLQVVKNDTAAIPAIDGRVKEIHQHITRDQDSQTRNEILFWLSPLDFLAKQETIGKDRMAGTCEWLLHRVEFQTWLRTKRSTLWCPGIPGAGKTVMMSAVIDHLKQEYRDHETANIAYVYFDYGQQGRHRLHDILCDIYKQLLQNTESVPSGLTAFYTRFKGREMPRENTHIIELLNAEIKQRPTFIAIDALDECHEKDRTPLLKILQSLEADVRLVVSSRPFDSIATYFKHQPCLKIRADRGDMKKYISNRLQHESSFSKTVGGDTVFGDEIVKVVIGKAQDMFLLVRLHMDSLGESRTKRRMREQLDNLPEKLAATYDQAMQRIKSQIPDFVYLANHTLSWVTNACRPLKLVELCHALATEFGDSRFDEEGLPDAGEITSYCAGLVVFEPVDSTIRFVHYTTQEYFSDKRNATRYPDAHLDITRKCLTYLLFDDLFQTRRSREELLQDYPLIGYAACHWGHHAQGDPENDQQVQSMALRLLKKELRPSDEFMVNPQNEDSLPNQPSHLQGGSHGLHIAASFGLTVIVSLLLKTGIDVDQTHDDGQTALHWACKNGHLETVRYLIDQQADVNTRMIRNPSTPIVIAAANGRLPIVELLVNNHAEINDDCPLFYQLGVPGLPALQEASLHGHTEMAKYLLDHGALMTIGGRSAIERAIEGKRFDIVQLFVERGVKLQGVDGWFAAKRAIDARSPNILQFLLDAGIDINTTPQFEVSILEHAINSGYAACLEVVAHAISSSSETADPGVPAISILTKQRWFADVEELPVPSQKSQQVADSTPSTIRRKYIRRKSLSFKDDTPPGYFGLVIPEEIPSVQRLIFQIHSHDQGWSSRPPEHHGTYNDSWTWFTCFAQFRSEPGCPYVEHRLQTNIHASDQYHTHTITWDRDSSEPNISDCVARLRAGDIIQVFARACFLGWVNYVNKVEVEICS